MKLLIDMNLTPRWVAYLHDAGFAAEHWSMCGPVDASDTSIMAFAQTGDYVVLTHDLDFGAILAATHGQKPSVIQLRGEMPIPETIGSLLVQALEQLQSELVAGALLTIDLKRARLRLLPLLLDNSGGR